MPIFSSDSAIVAPFMVDGNIIMGKVNILKSHMNTMIKSFPISKFE